MTINDGFIPKWVTSEPECTGWYITTRLMHNGYRYTSVNHYVKTKGWQVEIPDSGKITAWLDLTNITPYIEK